MKIKNTLRKLLIFLLAPMMTVALITACGSDDNGMIVDPPNGNGNGDEEQTIVDIAQGNDDFSILVDLVVQADLVDVLATDVLTVFAPTNDAFEDLFETVNPDDLSQEDIIEILTFHVTEGSVLSTDFIAGDNAVDMLNEEQTLVQASAAGVLVNGFSTVISADIEASNGVIHAVDAVLLPSQFRDPSIVELALGDEEGRFDTLAGLVQDASGGGLELLLRLTYLPGYTAFAPTNDAFDALFEEIDPASLSDEELVGILTYHVAQGEAPILSTDLEAEQTVPTLANEEPVYVTASEEGVFVNGSAQVVIPDIEGANGVIHAVDEVLLPNLVNPVAGIVSKNYNLTTLLGLVAEREEILATLRDPEGEFTLFAPTNEAFEEIMDAVAELSDEEITDILLYHVLDARVLSGDLDSEQTVEALNGSTMDVTVDNGTVTINGSATVEVADLQGTNGVVHIVDEVLIPEEEEVSDATITINNIGAGAWEIVEIDGEGASGDTGEENPTLTLEAEKRYTIVNEGAAGHPLNLLDGEGDLLIGADSDGSLQDYEPANVQVSDDGETISFTLTGDLADWLSSYICSIHPAMEGEIIVN